MPIIPALRCLRLAPFLTHTHHRLRSSLPPNPSPLSSNPANDDPAAAYADRLQAAALKKGFPTVEALRQSLRQQPRQDHRPPSAPPSKQTPDIPQDEKQAQKRTRPSLPPNLPPPSSGRSHSGIPPLDSILNLPKLLQTTPALTPEGLTDLWNAYHQTKPTDPTGPGRLSASIPTDTYRAFTRQASHHPTFVLPLLRSSPDQPPSSDAQQPNYETYLLQTALLPPPPIPASLSSPALMAAYRPSELPCATVLFTPLEEYRAHGTFATPFLTLTHWTDLAASHDRVLVRADLTPSQTSGNTMLDPHHAQLLISLMQRFYLPPLKPDPASDARRSLLEDFTHRPDAFDFHKLIDVAYTL